MSNMTIHGITKTKLFNQAKEALETFQGSPITRESKVRQFLTNFFRLDNEHLLDSVIKTDTPEKVLDLDEKPGFFIRHKEADFAYDLTTGEAKLSSVVIIYEIEGFRESNVKIVQSDTDESGIILDPVPYFNQSISGYDYDVQMTEMERLSNFRMAINHAYDMCQWLANIKHVVEREDLYNDEWIVVANTKFGSTYSDPLIMLNFLKDVRIGGMVSRNEIEVALVKLCGVDTSKGYLHQDVINAVLKTEDIFGDKFASLKINN